MEAAGGMVPANVNEARKPRSNGLRGTAVDLGRQKWNSVERGLGKGRTVRAAVLEPLSVLLESLPEGQYQLLCLAVYIAAILSCAQCVDV